MRPVESLCLRSRGLVAAVSQGVALAKGLQVRRYKASLSLSFKAMLAADKLLLTSTIRKNATELKGKELALHKGNFDAVGTQAAVLAGFAAPWSQAIEIFLAFL